MDTAHVPCWYRNNDIRYRVLRDTLHFAPYLGSCGLPEYLRSGLGMSHLIFRMDLLFRLQYQALRLRQPVRLSIHEELPYSSSAMASQLQILHSGFPLHLH